jgi:myo-inositol-1(or 4)-monophosphatase
LFLILGEVFINKLSMKKTLISALKISGEELLKHFGKTIDFKVKESQSSIVTKADLKSDSLIVKLISDRFPSHNIISEESGYSNRQSKYTWVIDPLDGTSNFASSLPWFGILIALFENNTPIMGGAYLPTQDILYFAEKGKGALKNGKVFTMERNSELKNSLFSFSVDFTDDEAVLNESISIYKNLVKATRNIRCTNSLVDFLYVAEGKFGGCINLFTKIWDISALGLIISESGGIMKDISGNDIKFSLDEYVVEKNFAVIAGSEKIVLELQKSVLKIKG